MNELDLFIAANAITDPAERVAYLERACADQPELRRRLEALLAGNAQSRHPLDQPPSHPPAADEPTHTFGNPPATGTYRPAPSADEAEGAVIAGRYKLRQRIGEGGMGTVWMADQTAPVKRRVAVKLIRTDRGASRTILSRFEAERQAIALMDHPHVAKLLDAGTTEAGAPFFVMELVKGVPLTEFCDAHRLSIPERLSLFMQVCGAVQHAHQKGIIHRDLKPSNVLVESHDGKPVPKVIDFGLAKATTGLQLTEHTLFTGFGSVMGTPLYMAPEQAAFNAVDVDTRADVYALGVILYELLTGTTPLTREAIKKAQLDEMLKLIREQDAPTPSSRLSSSDSAPSVAANRQTEPAKLGRFVRGELDWIVLKALSKDRERRYETATGFARDIDRFLNHEPVTAGPVGLGYRVGKYVRRNKGPVLAGALLLLALLLGIAGTTFGLMRAEQKRVEAEQAKEREAERADGERRAKEEAVRAGAAEQLARTSAQNRLAEVEKAADILAQVFQGLDPYTGVNEGPPLRQWLSTRLRAAAERINAGAIGDPMSEAKVRHALGLALLNLDDPKAAIQSLGRVVTIYTAQLGADDPKTLLAGTDLLIARRRSGDRPPVADMERHVARLTAVLGDGDSETLRGKYELVGCLLDTPRRAEGMTLLAELLQHYRAAGDTDGVEVTGLQLRLAQGHLAAGEWRQAGPILNDLVPRVRKKHGQDHIRTQVVETALGRYYVAAGQPQQAIPIFERALRASELNWGPTHPQAKFIRNELANTYRLVGRSVDAIPLFESLCQPETAKSEPDYMVLRENLAHAYRDVGRLDDALPIFQACRSHFLKERGEQHRATLNATNSLAACYWSMARYRDAIPLFEGILRQQVALPNLGPNQPFTFQTVNNLARNYLDDGRTTDARLLLDEWRPRIVAQQGEAHPDAVFATITWARVLGASGETDTAARTLRALLTAQLTAPSRNGFMEGRSLVTLGTLLLASGRFADAEPVLRECLSIRDKAEPDAWSTSDTRAVLGGALLGLMKYAEAEPLLVKGYEGLKQREKQIPPQAGPRIPEVLDRLIELYTATDRPAEAAKYRQLRAAYREVLPPPRTQK